jgi:hypothetical protein
LLRQRSTVVALATFLVWATAVTPSAAQRAEKSETPDPCGGVLRTVSAYRDAFASLPSVGTRYETADGYVPVSLPDGRTAWLMSDTLLTQPAGVGRSTAFVHNSIVVQRGRCFTPVLGGTAESRTDLVPSLFGRWCWPGSGVARGHTLLVFCSVVSEAPGPPGFGFTVDGTAVATFHLPDLTFRHLTALPFAETARVPWGSGSTRIGDTVYVYGSTAGSAYVARARFNDVTRGPWKFWNGRRWGTRATAAPMHFGHGTPDGQPFVAVDGRGFRAVAFRRDVLDPQIDAWSASRPQGPWRWQGTAALAHTVAPQFAYDARVVDLGPAGWTVIYNVNDPDGPAPDLERYGGRFAVPRRPRVANSSSTRHENRSRSRPALPIMGG